MENLDTWFGRTYLEPLAQIRGTISRQSYRKQQKLSAKKPPLFLCLKTDGLQPDASPEWSERAFSIAWRVLDAQFWGVPQRRRRIALVADFGGSTAPEILFERKGMPGNIEESGEKGQGTSGDAENGVKPDDSVLGDRVKCLTPWDCQSKRVFDPNGAFCTLPAMDAGGANNTAVFCIQGNCIDRADTAGCNGKGWTEDVSYTLNTIDRPAVTQVALLNDQGGSSISGQDNAEVSPTIRAEMHGNIPAVAYDARGNGDGEIVPTLTGDHENRITDYTSVVVHNGFAFGGFGDYRESDTASTIKSRDYKDATDLIVENGEGYTWEGARYIVRRLTPLECERLQGYPDGWTDIGAWTDTKGKAHKNSTDSARYKALGNSIAIPPWAYVLGKLSLCCGSDHTMASLFDGIGGFPLIWERLNGRGSCVWASEIEEFPIAVTKKHFAEEDETEGKDE